MKHHPPAHLIVGTTEQLIPHVEHSLQEHFCPSFETTQGNCFCSQCKKIKQRQHSLIVWISPEKNYTVDDIQIIFDTVRFTLDPDQQFFFIIDNAHTLTAATANRLLKVLEEPPTGYHFMLLTINKQSILPTIASRCVVTELIQPSSLDMHNPLFAFFFDPALRHDPFGFEAELKKQALSDTESFEILQQLINHVALQVRGYHQTNKPLDEHYQYLQRIHTFLINAMRKPPQSGSSDLFWKHLFVLLP